VWWPLLPLSLASVLLACCRSFAGSSSPTFHAFTPGTPGGATGLVEAGGCSVQLLEGKGNELMKSHLGGNRGIYITVFVPGEVTSPCCRNTSLLQEGSSVARYKWMQLIKNITCKDCRQVEAGGASYYKLCGAVKFTS